MEQTAKSSNVAVEENIAAGKDKGSHATSSPAGNPEEDMTSDPAHNNNNNSKRNKKHHHHHSKPDNTGGGSLTHADPTEPHCSCPHDHSGHDHTHHTHHHMVAPVPEVPTAPAPFIGHETKIVISDGRYFIGTLVGYDAHANCILQSVTEYRDFPSEVDEAHYLLKRSLIHLSIPSKYILSLHQRKAPLVASLD